MLTKYIRLLSASIIMGTVLLTVWQPQVVNAQASKAEVVKAKPKVFSLSLVPASCQDEDGCNICEVVKVFTNAATIIAAVLSSVALLMFVIGGFMLIFSGGQPEKIERGKKVLIGTVSGIGVVFLAWFAVNVIVRISATSGVDSSGGVGTTTTIFTKPWWEFNTCQPALPTTCKGLSVGELCGAGECTASSKKAACSCYRPLDSAGDSNVCQGDDATSITGANTKTKKCYCTSQCFRLSLKTNKSYKCMLKANAKKDTIVENYPCPKEGYVCAL